jgi:hypothetical protein
LGNFGTFFPQKFTLDIFFKFFLITKWWKFTHKEKKRKEKRGTKFIKKPK